MNILKYFHKREGKKHASEIGIYCKHVFSLLTFLDSFQLFCMVDWSCCAPFTHCLHCSFYNFASTPFCFSQETLPGTF